MLCGHTTTMTISIYVPSSLIIYLFFLLLARNSAVFLSLSFECGAFNIISSSAIIYKSWEYIKIFYIRTLLPPHTVTKSVIARSLNRNMCIARALLIRFIDYTLLILLHRGMWRSIHTYRYIIFVRCYEIYKIRFTAHICI